MIEVESSLDRKVDWKEQLPVISALMIQTGLMIIRWDTEQPRKVS